MFIHLSLSHQSSIAHLGFSNFFSFLDFFEFNFKSTQMFSSTSLNPFLPHLISSFSLNTSPLVSETNRFSFPPNTQTNDHFYDPLNNMAPPPPLQRAPPPPSHAMVSNYVDNQHNPSASSSTFLIKSCKTGSTKSVKKDRHSKICTAQGLRDRRVRLSIGIARKFFDLQDMLGFDKASKTLEWLLNKSKKAIKEVQEVSTNNNNGSSSTTTAATSSTCEVVSEKNGDEFSKSGGEKKLQRSSSLNFSVHMAKESRAKARARARERTRVKMYTKRSSQSDINPHVLDQMNQTCEKLKVATYDHQLEEPNKGINVIEESSLMVIKRKLKPNNGIVGTYQQSHVMLKDVNCINTNNSINLMNSPQNWDFSSAIARSSFCAITNVNPSTGLHLCGKFWEAEGNYCPN